MATTPNLTRHLRALGRRDPHISRGVREAGTPKSRGHAPGFPTLIRIIIDQQVSTAAGLAIWRKLEAVCDGKVDARVLLDLGHAKLRANGFSNQKANYALGVAEAVRDGALDFDVLETLDDDAVRSALTALKGIGPWSADIYLMFAMGRPDIWPVGDLALQHGARLLMNLRKKPTPERLDKIGEAWRPYRSSAALMLWHYYGFRTRR
ncbi:MAG: DNA-3-methyladenine glycosylase 2 family protein [Rhodobacteraceae bacterium]|nr:DNA-3-methyladenine glycosylase 2 family protein [Paracoccaceae bacterium]